MRGSGVVESVCVCERERSAADNNNTDMNDGGTQQQQEIAPVATTVERDRELPGEMRTTPGSCGYFVLR
jgi:hypothetical protein